MSDVTKNVRTPVVRLSYAHLVEPKQYKEDGKPKGPPTFNTEFIVEADDLKNFEISEADSDWEKAEDLNKLLASVARAEWGSDLDIEAAVKHGGMKWPVIDGNARIAKKEKDSNKKGGLDQYKDKKIIRGKSSEKYPPRLWVREAEGFTQLDRDSEEDMAKAKKLFYSGAYVVATLSLVPNEVDERKYLTFYMNNVMFYKKGDRLGGTDPSKAFAGYEGGASDFDPSEGMDEDIPMDI